MPDDTTTLVCQAEDCFELPSYVCDAYVMTPPCRGFIHYEIYLCSEHATRFEQGSELSVLLEPTNPDLVSVARFKPD